MVQVALVSSAARDVDDPEAQARRCFEIVQQVTIDKPRSDVWNALVDDIDSWWAFRIGEAGSRFVGANWLDENGNQPPLARRRFDICVLPSPDMPKNSTFLRAASRHS